METFTVDWGRSWLARLLGRNDLVRKSDRLEAIAITVAVVAMTLAVPVAAAFGTWVKDARSAVYIQQSQSRHQTTVTALEDATLHVQVYSQTLEVQARWAADGRVHHETVTPPEMVRTGDRFDIWVDENGEHVNAPTPVRQAASDAVGSAALAWLTVAGVLAAATYLLHRRLDRTRFDEWDRDLDSLADNDGGRTNR